MQCPLNIHYPLISKTAIKYIFILLFFFFYSSDCKAQGKEANIWYFGEYAGVDFGSGSPVAITDGALDTMEGCATISDENGDVLFYTEGTTVWNKNHQIMENGTGLLGHFSSTQSAIIVPKPGSNFLYYIFTVPEITEDNESMYYSIVDISLNNGLGAIIEKNIFLFEPITEKVTAIVHQNGIDYWVVTHARHSNAFCSFLVSSAGVNSNPVVSNVGTVHEYPTGNYLGYLKASPMGNYIACAIYGPLSLFEMFDFDIMTGLVSNPITFHDYENAYGLEFSPNESRLYLGIYYNQREQGEIFQVNLNAGSPNDIINSATSIGTSPDQTLGALQVGTDQKIYVSIHNSYYLGVINYPNELDNACNFVLDGFYLNERISKLGLPSFIQSYFTANITYQNNCFGDSTFFDISTSGPIQSISWNFGDPTSGANNISTNIQPSHVFTSSGIYTVTASILFTTGQSEVFYLDVTIYDLPQVNLGNDTTICFSQDILLDAECGPHTYVWSTGQSDTCQITVSDTGWYWVNVTSNVGCTGLDSIHIAKHPPATADTTNLIISPTTCGGSTGAIRNLLIVGTPPYTYQWLDDLENPIATTIDMYQLPVGNYTLQVTDSNNCITTLGPYSITDAGDILIENVDYVSAYCDQQDGSITVVATSGLNDMLFYSIDNGATYYANQGIFIGLSPGSYAVRVKDSLECQDVFINNPIIIENLSGPLVTTIDVSPETDYTSDGSIYIEAIVGSGNILFSIDSGFNFQTNNGLFENLIAGTYYCVVQDEFGCDTTFIVELERIISQIIDAIAGDGYTCIGNATASPLLLSNFTDVYSFDVMLSYDKDLIVCDGYIQVHPDLVDGIQVSVIPAIGEVHITWLGQSPTTLPDNSLMAELVFSGIDEGLSQVDWIAEQGESQFYNENGDLIHAEFQLGLVIIYTRPDIMFSPPIQEECEGKTVIIEPLVSGGTGEYDLYWSGPDNFSSDNDTLYFSEATANMAGIYNLTVTDTINCVESKSMELIVYMGPSIAFAPYDTLWVDPGYLLEAGFGADSYFWNTGETTESIIIDTIGCYNVEVTSYEDCKSTDTVQILWGGDPFYVPNAFTPNSDGLNDVFGIVQKYDYVNRFHMNIYNRWGQMIFETTDINNGWDGTYQGSPCMMGAYVYCIVYEEFGQQPMESNVVEGTVMLIR